MGTVFFSVVFPCGGIGRLTRVLCSGLSQQSCRGGPLDPAQGWSRNERSEERRNPGSSADEEASLKGLSCYPNSVLKAKRSGSFVRPDSGRPRWGQCCSRERRLRWGQCCSGGRRPRRGQSSSRSLRTVLSGVKGCSGPYPGFRRLADARRLHPGLLLGLAALSGLWEDFSA